MMLISSVHPAPSLKDDNKALMVAAQKLEASFLAEMLKSAGLGATSAEFGGGAGEDQFSSFLVQEQAMAMVKAGGIGLSESLYEALKERQDEF
ncbi:rod-binding protein [Sulfitobacter sp. S0837]|uniref:rod-binding protein n=1 Tax=Sulfitobacter maritimus TaxID=2741719 RepID=UPI001582A3A2|nr:rod-binding protein [Sulfitobacter maritimus]NUH66794.1 rod-binding protein [Sulfitobacter maritimus]